MPVLPFGLEAGPVLALAGAALVAGLARGFSGFGGALIFVPLASTVFGPRIAAPLMLLVDGLMTLGLVPRAWRLAARREVATVAFGALAGAPLGTVVLAVADPVALRWGIVLLVLALLAFLMSGWRYRGRATGPLAVGTGIVAGFLGGVAQVSGPPVAAYWLGRALPGPQVRANLILYFAMASCVSAATYLAGGLITTRVLALFLAAGPPYALGLAFGARLFGLASEVAFRRICYALIAAAAVLGAPALDAVLR